MPEGWICQFERVEWRIEGGRCRNGRAGPERWKCVRCGRLIKVSCHCSLYSQIGLMVHRIIVQSLYWFKPVLEQNTEWRVIFSKYGSIRLLVQLLLDKTVELCIMRIGLYLSFLSPSLGVARGLDQSFLISFAERDLWRQIHPVFVGDSPFCRFD